MDIPSNNQGSGTNITDENKHKTSDISTAYSPNSKLVSHKATSGKRIIPSTDSAEEQPLYKKKSLNSKVGVVSTSTPSIHTINIENSSLDVESILGRDDVEQMKQLISTDFSENKNLLPNSKGHTLLHKAAEYGASNCVRVLIEKSPNDVQKKDYANCLPLHLAASKGHTDCVKILTEINPDSLQHKDCFGQTPVLLAARYGKIDSLKFMLNFDSGVEALCRRDDRYYFTPLHWAAKNGDISCVKIIVEKDPNTMAKRDHFDYTPIHHATEHGYTRCIEYFVKKSPECLSHSYCTQTLVQLAIQHGHTKALQYMLNQKVVIEQLTKFKLYHNFITSNKKCAQLIKNSREKNKMPFKPVKNFDINQFNATYCQKKQSLTVEALTDSNNYGKEKVNKSSAINRLNLNPQIETAPDEINQAKALLSGLGSVGVCARCQVYGGEKESEFWSMGDASACIQMIKTLAYLGAKNIHVKLSPPDDSPFNLRKGYNADDRKKYNKKQRIALSKLAYLLPEFNINDGTPQEISVFDSKVIISCCDDPVEDIPVAFSFIAPCIDYNCYQKLFSENYIHIYPYRFQSEKQTIYTDIDGEDCNIIPINAPTNSVVANLETKRENDVIKLQSDNHNKEILFESINQLCSYSKNKQALVGVVYGLHHKNLQGLKSYILINWFDAIKAEVKKTGDDRPVIIIGTANSLDSGTLKKVVETTGAKIVDFSNDNAIRGLIPLKSGEFILGIMPNLPQPAFNKLVRHSNLPTLAEGANLTSFLLQNGHAHLSLLPSGNTPVAQDMGYPLEALKAQAFSYKLIIGKDKKDKNKLEKLLELVKENKYQEALSFIKEIKDSLDTRGHDFLWKTPKLTGLQLKSVTIISLLEKGENMGSIEKEALISAIDPSNEARANYIASCLEEDSPTNDHFKLQQMHVGQSFNHAVASALVKFGQYKKLLPE
jgi:hypothetical protein